MGSKARSPDVSDWRAIASLGEQLVNASSLPGQRDRIISMVGRVVHGTASVWLNEKLFRLPDRTWPREFPPQPRSEGMRRVVAGGKTYVQGGSKGGRPKHALAAVAIEDRGFMLGVLQVTRAEGPDFGKDELELLESVASVVAVGLYASHRVEVERFRLGELNLVSQVSAEISNMVNLDELSRRVCELIQKTFNYYYVAIFTLKPGKTRLRFRSGARAAGKAGKKTPLGLEVELGQGLIGEAALAGEVIVAADVLGDTRYRYVAPLPETRSEVVIPLKLENRVLGVLDVQSDHVNAFHPNDLMVLQALADNIARAVEGARLYGDVQRRADQLALVADVSRSVTSTLELDMMMNEAAALIHDRLGVPHVNLFTVHPNRRMIEYEAGSGRRSHGLHGYTLSLDDPQGLIPWVAREGKTVLVNDVDHEPRYRPSPLPPKNTRSELTVPLMFGERVLGVLDIQSDRQNAFTEDDGVMFEAVAGTIAAAIRNADLYRSEQWRLQVSDSLREVAGLLSEHISVEQALELILVELERNLPVDVSVIWLMDDGELHVAAAHGIHADAIEQRRGSDPEASAGLMRIMQAAEPVIRQPSDPMWPSGQAAGFSSNYSSLAAPLRVNDQPVGLISLSHRSPGRYGHEARAMTATFASYAAVAIENARLYDAAQEQAYASAALLQVAQAVSSPGELDEILGSIVRSMPILIGVPRAVLYGWDELRHKYLPRAAFGLTGSTQAAPWSVDVQEGDFKLLDSAREAGATRVHALGARSAQRARSEIDSWRKLRPSEDTEKAVDEAARLLIAVPLLIKSDFLGVLVVEEAAGAKRYRLRRIEIIEGISRQIAVAMQNDLLQNEMVVRERLETEVQLARQIQKTFIPEMLPRYEGWELAARWQTARQVGGDFYDLLELPDGKLGMFIADVADKGMPAALFMALTRTLFRAAAAEATSPAQVLKRVNDLLMPDTRQGMFVTAVYAVLDVRTGELTYANAGHNPPLWIRRDGRPERLTRTAIALGVVESGPAAEKTIQLGNGDGVLFYTDGVTEAFSPTGELFGEARLIDEIQAQPLSSADGLLLAIEAGLEDFRESLPLADDLTMLVVRRT